GLSRYDLGKEGGDATLVLSQGEMPSHRHDFYALTDQAKSASPDGNQLARAFAPQANTDNVVDFYSPNPQFAADALSADAIGPSGGGAPHDNMQPYLTLCYCIARQGIYPPRDGNAPAPWTPFIGEIGIFAFGMAPPNWLPCAGQLLSIVENTALF